MKTAVVFVIFVFAIATTVIGLPSSSAAQAPKEAYRQTLAQPTEIQGYPCAKGYGWFYPDGKLQKCTVTRDIPFGEITIPAGSWITLAQDGKPRGVQMPHDAPVLGLTCQGGSFLGPSEGSVVALYPNGKLHVCYLAHDQPVQGVPCGHGGFWASLKGPDPGVLFTPDGRLKQCRLSADYQGRGRGELFVANR
jgi:hypothetical protein